MNKQTIYSRGTEINKIPFFEIEGYIEKKGINVNEAFMLMADDQENVYVSNGFVSGLLRDENEPGEWHHYFKKEGNYFEAYKLKF